MNFILTTSETINLINSAVSLLAVSYLGLIKFAQAQVKVDTLWQFQLRRGEVEAVLRGYATKNSPLNVNDERALNAFPSGLAQALQQHFSRLGRNLTGVELASEIERHFGARLVDEVCMPQGISEGASLILAMHFAQGAGAPPSSAAMRDSEFEAVEKLKRVAEVGEVIICVRDENGQLRPVFKATEQDVAYWKIVVQVFQGVAGLKMIGGVAKQLMIALAAMIAVVMWVSGKIHLTELMDIFK
jgi:hypothetical protein